MTSTPPKSKNISALIVLLSLNLPLSAGYSTVDSSMSLCVIFLSSLRQR